MGKETVFTKIRDGVIPSYKLYEDEYCFVILDINPVSKGHGLVISKEPYSDMSECPADVLSHLVVVASELDKRFREKLKCDATNVLINNGPASGQEIPHIHIHVIPRYKDDKVKFCFTHVAYAEGEMERYFKELSFHELR